jgi:hypothetical protein
MAAMFDWMKGDKGKGKARRRSSGGKRSDGAKRRGAATKRDPSNSTEFIAPPQQAEAAPAPTPSAAPAPAAAPVAAAPPQPAAADAGATQYHAVGNVSTVSMVGILIVKTGKAMDEIYKVYDGENIMGRGPTAQVRTDNQDDAISREHATIIHESGSFGIKPLKEGMNPTFLNDVEVAGGAALADGDLIRIGNTTLKFRTS